PVASNGSTREDGAQALDDVLPELLPRPRAVLYLGLPEPLGLTLAAAKLLDGGERIRRLKGHEAANRGGRLGDHREPLGRPGGGLRPGPEEDRGEEDLLRGQCRLLARRDTEPLAGRLVDPPYRGTPKDAARQSLL